MRLAAKELNPGVPRPDLWQGGPLMDRDEKHVLNGTDGDGVGASGTTDGPAFADRAGRYRSELHVHCYRMLASFDEAEDALQETMLRAWHRRSTFQATEVGGRGPDGLRPWLYRIATNVCLDMLRVRRRRVGALHSLAEVPWLQPYPDRLLDIAAPIVTEPESALVARETIELTFLALIQLLPARQRAVLILCDVLDWPVRNAALLLDTSVAAVNSALQRARATMRKHGSERRAEWSQTQPRTTQGVAGDQQVTRPSAVELELLDRYIKAHEQGWDLPELVALDVRLTMPPQPQCHEGWAQLRPFVQIARAMGEWRLTATRANRMPAAACYLRRPGEAVFHAYKLDVLRVENGLIAEFTTFALGPSAPTALAAFDLPTTLEV